MGNVKHCAAMAALTLGIMMVPVFGRGSAVFANNYEDDEAWQFQTTADMANEAAVASLIQQKQNHMFQPPTSYYNTNDPTNIGTENNCIVSSTAAGNSGTNTEGGNTSSASGAQAASTGNTGTSSISGEGTTGVPGELTNSQTNPGTVTSTSSGNSTSSSASGSVTEALNSSQTNDAAQNSTQTGNTACLTNSGAGNSGTIGSSNGGALN